MNKKVCTLLGLLGAIAAFTVPYIFPSSAVSVSASYDYGFNNKIGVLILAFTSLVILYISFKGNTNTGNVYFFVKTDESLKRTFLWLLVIEILLCVFVWFCTGHTFGVGESGFFLPKLNDLIHGRKLYTEIDFPYGSLLLYIPAAFYYVMPFLGVQGAYFLAFTIANCVGFYLLYNLLCSINFDKKVKIWLLVGVFLIGGKPISAGMNYSFIRFVPPLYFLYRINSGLNKNSVIKNLFLIIASSIISFNLSPEIGIVYGVTLIISYLVFAFIEERKYMLYSILSLLILITQLYLGFMVGMFSGIGAFLSGSLNWPFVFSLPLVFFFTEVFVLAYQMGKQLRSIKENFVLLSLELMSCGMLLGALGRCDPGHLFWNGLFLLLVFIYFHSKVSVVIAIVILFHLAFPHTIVTYGKMYGLSFLTNPYVSSFFHSELGKGIVMKMAQLTGSNMEKVKIKLENSNWEISEELQKINDVALPLSLISSNLYSYLVNTGKIHYLPYMDTHYYGSETAINKQFETFVKSSPQYILLPKNWEKMSDSVDYESDIKLLFSVPFYRVRALNNGNILYQPVINYIKDNYKYLYEINSSYYVFKRKDVDSRATQNSEDTQESKK